MKSENKKSRHFTVTVRREFPRPLDEVFLAWTNPEIRRNVLASGRYKNNVKEIAIEEGGYERYEDRWKNHLYGVTTRRNLIIRPMRMIVSHTEMSMTSKVIDQHFALQELLLFKPKGDACEIVASDQCIAIEPTYIHSAKDTLNEVFDAFAAEL